MGAYRPPGARGLATPAIFKREDEGGSRPPSGASTPQRGYSPAPNASGRGGRYVPGAATNGHEGRQNGHGHGHGHHSPSRPANGRHDSGGKEGGKGEGKEGGRKRNKGAKKGTPQQQGGENANANGNGNVVIPEIIALPPNNLIVEPELLTPMTPGGDSSLDPIAKKVRNLNKKLKAIEELKEKAKRGERLEATQIKKMEGEAEIKKELAALGVTA
ncbi:hypothetical protein MPER_09716 [Moniliophthora perniciosa FA553]|nr:hypothetical protein MPER_09716 [Moniliophthora perniciosa FA553]